MTGVNVPVLLYAGSVKRTYRYANNADEKPMNMAPRLRTGPMRHIFIKASIPRCLMKLIKLVSILDRKQGSAQETSDSRGNIPCRFSRALWLDSATYVQVSLAAAKYDLPYKAIVMNLANVSIWSTCMSTALTRIG